ncbi:Y+L amino acid transporter 2 like protein [Argiope bruennichi]|uniref:Y+L amino acid transporter 2 like protein n=1 Tax=Argiope bruennichi TaxID=94029 RepID=A0A8T0FBB7_ARGBR|nr:Y+L amino acid transporter 2 like protein [Argiope bruennichi]
MGLASSVSMTLSSIIGAGIFISPKGVLKYAGSAGMSLVVWSLSGLISMIGAMCFIELGTSIPISGSDYSYLLICFGELPAFLYLWAYILIIVPVYNVILCLTFANYIFELVLPNCGVPDGVLPILASLPICLLTYVNCREVHWATRVQGIFTSAKMLTVTAIIVSGIYYLCSGNTQNLDDAFHGTTKNPSFMALSFYHGLYSFAGWSFTNHVVEELKNPTINLPRNIYISLTIVTIIYILANVAYLAVLTPNEILTSKAVAVSFGEKIFGLLFSSVMSLSVVLSTLGTMNCRIYRCSRLFMGAARRPFTNFRRYLLLTLTYLSSTEILFLVNYGQFVSAIFDFLTVVGFLWLRYKEPHLERPIKVSLFFPIAYLLIFAFLLTFALFAGRWEPLMGIAVVSTGIPIYMVAVFWKNKPNFYNKISRKFTSFAQKLLLSVPEEKDE